MEPNNHPKTIARWLRRCVEDPRVADQCHSCPFGLYASMDEDRNCMDELHYAAAELIERQNRIQKEFNQ